MTGLSGMLAAPAVVRASSLMPVSSLAPYMTIDPTKVGTLLEETLRAYGATAWGEEKVVSIGNGYEAGYILEPGKRYWIRGFLDDKRLDVPGTAPSWRCGGVINPEHGWRAGIEKARIEVEKKTKEAQLLALMQQVPLGLERGRPRLRGL